jgi:hypothetical protein
MIINILFYFFFFKKLSAIIAIYEIMWKNIIKQDTVLVILKLIPYIFDAAAL